MEELLSVAEIAEKVGISKNTLRKVIRENSFNDYYSAGTKMFFSEKQVVKLIKTMKKSKKTK